VRRVLVRTFIGFLGLLAVLFATIAIVVYSMVSFGDTLRTQDVTTSPEDLIGCTSLLMDIENVRIGGTQGDFVLGSKEAYVTFFLRPDQNMTGVVLDPELIEDLLLGRQTCVVQVSDSTALTVTKISSGDQSIEALNLEPLGDVFTGNRLVIPADSSVLRSLIIVPNDQLTEGSILAIAGILYYPQASNILKISAVSSTVLLITTLVFGWTTRRKSPDIG
jgi:hypothetical protein